MIITLVVAALLGYWLMLCRLVKRERGKVCLTASELAMRRLQARMIEFQVVLATAIAPALQRAAASIAEFGRALGIAVARADAEARAQEWRL